MVEDRVGLFFYPKKKKKLPLELSNFLPTKFSKFRARLAFSFRCQFETYGSFSKIRKLNRPHENIFFLLNLINPNVIDDFKRLLNLIHFNLIEKTKEIMKI